MSDAELRGKARDLVVKLRDLVGYGGAVTQEELCDALVAITEIYNGLAAAPPAPAGTTDPWMNLETLGQLMHRWRQHNFPGRDECRDALQICEEAGELARAVGKEADGIRAGTRGSTPEELGDVQLAIAALAARKGINLAQVTRTRRDRALKMDFQRWPETGFPPEVPHAG